ncbi:hypothetical protein LshimejAT787_0606100 [Lyophyllum shimeji]|uniref:Uncharacterized protein n=1 Tax=Lyophyllum shimeji TaxID=47721 RepID=A0A9P3PP31_LYOSH|nr:hypothetical protein LshimejAT787_0606100 [Lyophyllum shimeji]
MGMIIGLLIPIGNMYKMASRHTSEPLTDVLDPRQQTIAFSICSDIAKRAGVRWVPVDYPKGSKRACIVMPLYERDDGAPLRMEQWAASRGFGWVNWALHSHFPHPFMLAYRAYPYDRWFALGPPSQPPASTPSALTFAPNIKFLGLLPAPNSLKRYR